MERQRILIDTSVLIDYLRKTNKELSLFARLSVDYDFAISTITEFEFLIGSTDTNRSFMNALMKLLLTIPFDSQCVATAVDIYRSLKATSNLLPLPDIAIAATALTHNLSVATFNIDHFQRIQGIVILAEK